MDIYYSPSTPGFFSTVIYRKEELPNDAMQISSELHQLLMEGESQGEVISINRNGLPFLEDVPKLPVVISHAQIDAERDRRIDAGISFNGVLYQSNATDRENISGAAQMAFMAVVGGAQPGNLRWSNPDQDFAWICAENTLVTMDAQTVVEFWRAAALRKSELIHAGRALKDMPVLPENFTDNEWWPA